MTGLSVAGGSLRKSGTKEFVHEAKEVPHLRRELIERFDTGVQQVELEFW